MTTTNNSYENILKNAHSECEAQIQEAMKILNVAMQTLRNVPSASSPITANSGQQEPQATTTSPQPSSESTNTHQSSPIMNALKSSMSNAHEAIKAAEAGVKTAMEAAEQHVQHTMQSFAQNPGSNPSQSQGK